MKTAERRHLKENEVQRWVRETSELIDQRRREVTALVIVVAVVGGGALGWYAWHSRTQARAHALLADVMTVDQARVAPPAAPGAPLPPGTFPTERARAEAALAKFKAAADAYPSTDAGIFARYQQAATLMTLDRPAEAVAAYDEVIKRAGDGIYGQMARLGRAEAQARAGNYNDAIAAFSDLAQRKDGPLPVDGILMQLAQTYIAAGKTADAQQTLNRIVQEYPASPYSGDARQRLEDLKKG